MPRGVINPLFFLGLYGVPSRHSFPYPRLMTATRTSPGTPRLPRAPARFSPRAHPLWRQAFCAPTNLRSGRVICVLTPLSGIPTPSKRMLKLPDLLQLGARSIATKASHPFFTSHRRPVAGRSAPFASRLQCRESRFHRDQSLIIRAPVRGGDPDLVGTSHRFCKSFGMNVYKLPFCYPLWNECLCHVGGGGGGDRWYGPGASLTVQTRRQIVED